MVSIRGICRRIFTLKYSDTWNCSHAMFLKRAKIVSKFRHLSLGQAAFRLSARIQEMVGWIKADVPLTANSTLVIHKLTGAAGYKRASSHWEDVSSYSVSLRRKPFTWADRIKWEFENVWIQQINMFTSILSSWWHCREPFQPCKKVRSIYHAIILS